MVLPDPGAPEKTVDSRARTHARRNSATLVSSMSRSTSSSQRAEGDPRELADVHEYVAVAADVAVDDVQAGPGVELGVLQALGGVELAVAAGRVVEDLGERPQDVLVVVEDLVVVAAGPLVALHEDLVGTVDHDLPHVVVGEERLERPVAGQVAERPLGDQMSGSVRSKARRPRLKSWDHASTSSRTSARSLARPSSPETSSDSSPARRWTRCSISCSGDTSCRRPAVWRPSNRRLLAAVPRTERAGPNPLARAEDSADDRLLGLGRAPPPARRQGDRQARREAGARRGGRCRCRARAGGRARRGARR